VTWPLAGTTSTLGAGSAALALVCAKITPTVADTMRTIATMIDDNTAAFRFILILILLVLILIPVTLV
jgi:hypothetical protein